jgi:predicted nucleic acid-binding protein
MKAISNSTPLIYLAKLNKFSLLTKLFEEIIIPEEVYDEVVLKGKELNKPETIIIQNFIERNFVKIEKIKPKLKIDTLRKGEICVISLGLKLGIKNILIDDKEGVEVCKVLGLKPFRTTTILLELLKRNLISLEEFENLLIELSKDGYFLRADVFKFLLKEAERLSS